MPNVRITNTVPNTRDRNDLPNTRVSGGISQTTTTGLTVGQGYLIGMLALTYTKQFTATTAYSHGLEQGPNIRIANI